MPDVRDVLIELLNFTRLVCRLKNKPQTGWNRNPDIRRDIKMREVKNPESIAAHTYGMLMLWFELAEYYSHLDRWKVARMIGVHALAKCVAWEDAAVVENGRDKKRKEKREPRPVVEEAVQRIYRRRQDGEKEYKLWKEYADQSSEEARFVKQLEVLEGVFQAVFYREAGQRIDPQEFADEARKAVTDENLGKLLGVLQAYIIRIKMGTLA